MKKIECIRRYGEATWAKWVKQSQAWGEQHREEKAARQRIRHEQHREEENDRKKKWREANPGKVIESARESYCKGGKYYDKKVEYQTTGLQGERFKIRVKHAKRYRPLKQATPNSVLHHEWIPGTGKYRGVALVEKEAHERGTIKVIKVLEGEITLFTEKEIAEQEAD